MIESAQSDQRRADQAMIDAATREFLRAGGTIQRLDNVGRTTKNLSWREESARTKAANLTYAKSGAGHAVLKAKEQPAQQPAIAAKRETIKLATAARSAKNRQRRAAMAPQVKALAGRNWPVNQIAAYLEVASKTVRRVGAEHGIALNTDRSARGGGI